MKKAGFIIFIAGLLVTLYTGFAYIRSERNLGAKDPEMTPVNYQTINWQPYIGIGVMIIGGACLALGRNKALTR